MSTPVTWDEVSACHESGDEPSCSRSKPHELLARVEDQGDLFAPSLGVQQNLPSLR